MTDEKTITLDSIAILVNQGYSILIENEYPYLNIIIEKNNTSMRRRIKCEDIRFLEDILNDMYVGWFL